jgi:uncharacterized protein (DUF58 family)
VLTGLAIWIAGYIFGATPLEQLGFAFVVLTGLAVGVVRLGRHDLEVVRSVTPERVGAGRPITVSLHVRNKGRGSAPLVLIEDRLPLGLRGRARFALHGVEPDGHRHVSLTLQTARRGRYSVGPLELSFIDPFGLARIRGQRAETTSFVVYPRIEPLGMPRDPGDRRSVATSAIRQPTVAQGEDFFTMREYAEGDDLRKIHWPSTAKRGRFMIRQEETPWHTRATVVLDDRAASHHETGSFERSVEAAASLLDLYHRSGFGFRFTGAHGTGLPTSRGVDHLGRCLDLLATIETEGDERDDDSLAARLTELGTSTAAEAVLVVVTGGLGAREAIALSRCRNRYRQITMISFPSHRFGSAPTKDRWAGEKEAVEVARLLERGGVRALLLGPDESLARGWSSARALHSRGTAWGRKPELV